MFVRALVLIGVCVCVCVLESEHSRTCKGKAVCYVFLYHYTHMQSQVFYTHTLPCLSNNLNGQDSANTSTVPSGSKTFIILTKMA